MGLQQSHNKERKRDLKNDWQPIFGQKSSFRFKGSGTQATLKGIKGKQIRTESKEYFESKVQKQKQHCVAVAVAVVVS